MLIAGSGPDHRPWLRLSPNLAVLCVSVVAGDAKVEQVENIVLGWQADRIVVRLDVTARDRAGDYGRAGAGNYRCRKPSSCSVSIALSV